MTLFPKDPGASLRRAGAVARVQEVLAWLLAAYLVFWLVKPPNEQERGDGLYEGFLMFFLLALPFVTTIGVLLHRWGGDLRAGDHGSAGRLLVLEALLILPCLLFPPLALLAIYVLILLARIPAA